MSFQRLVPSFFFQLIIFNPFKTLFSLFLSMYIYNIYTYKPIYLLSLLSLSLSLPLSLSAVTILFSEGEREVTFAWFRLG